MKQVILACSCHNQDKKAKEAFSLLSPNEPTPEIIRGRDRVYKFGREIGNDHIIAISKLSGKYAYYVELDGDKIIKEYDLVRGGRIS